MKLSKYLFSILPTIATIVAFHYNLEALMFFVNWYYIIFLLIGISTIAVSLALICYAYIKGVNFRQVATPSYGKPIEIIFSTLCLIVSGFYLFQSEYKFVTILMIVCNALSFIQTNTIKELQKDKPKS